MAHHGKQKAFWTALIAFLALAAVTVLFWRGQVDRQRLLLARHTGDVAFQASRRLQVFVESHLRVAALFAKRWATHEARDFSQRRFEEFGSVLLEELPGFHGLSLLSPGGGQWTVPVGIDHTRDIERFSSEQLFGQVRADGEVRLSHPVRLDSGQASFYAVLPLQRGGEALGLLLIQFQASTLIDDCFHEKIRSEFDFVVEDSAGPIYRFPPGGAEWQEHQAAMGSRVAFAVRNREWVISMVPKDAILADSRWSSNLAVPALGFPLASILAWLVWLLLRRVEMLRLTRDRAVQEVEERKRAEAALQFSEARHAQLSRKVLMAQEEERARLSRELHDELGQLLTALRLEMGVLQKSLGPVLNGSSGKLDNAVGLVETSAEELRRLCRGLRPPLLDDLGLEPALQTLIRDFVERTGITADYDIDCDLNSNQPSPEVALAAYRIMQEALNNISRHARTDRLSASVLCTAGELQLSVEDEGAGFEPGGLSPHESCGIEGMRERALLVGGSLTVTSTPGKGTRVLFRGPLQLRDEEPT